MNGTDKVQILLTFTTVSVHATRAKPLYRYYSIIAITTPRNRIYMRFLGVFIKRLRSTIWLI